MKQKIKFKETKVRMIPEDWEETTLGAVVTFQRGYDLPLKDRKEGKYPVIMSNGIGGYHNEFKAKGPGVTIGRSGNLGEPFYTEKEYWPHNTTLYIKKYQNAYPKFIYYFLKRLKLNRFNAGSAVPTLNRNHIHPISIIFPKKIDEQSSIAAILSSLDAKIELNHQMNKTLEAIGQAIFKRWFVDFEFPDEEGKPYKSSGREMVDSELGKIPKGWEIKSLDEITERITTGLNPRDNFVLGKGENFYVTIKNMTDLQEIILDNRCDRIDDDALIKIRSRSKVKIGDILFSGIATIGRVFLVDVSPEKWGLSESIFVFKANEMQIFTPILYRLLLSPDLQSYAQQLAIGSVQRGIRMADLKKYKVALPNINDQVDISDMFNRLIKKIKANNHENQALSQIRDSLLPRLMSGKIRVPVEVPR